METLEELSAVSWVDGQYVRPSVAKLPSEHTIYKIGKKRIAATTTISGRDPESKQALIGWANKLGLQGICSIAYLNHSANIGTMAHKMIESSLAGIDGLDIGVWIEWLYGEHPQFATYYYYATIAYKKYLLWLADNPTFEVIATEMVLIDEVLGYGGMIDVYGKLNGRLVLIDLKTSSDVYISHKIQVSGYESLLLGNDCVVDNVYILKLSRDPDTPYEFLEIKETILLFKRFCGLIADYYNEKEYNQKIKHGGKA